jgi:RimJ/RimL family protein N-acetyltransferase
MPIRTATPDDAASIGAIRVAAWQAAYRGAMPDSYLDALEPGANLDGLRTALGAEPPPFTLRVADDVEGQPVAFSIVGKPRYAVASPASTMELWALNVHPLHWRKGAGKELVLQALVDARAQLGVAVVELWCLHSNAAAQGLYEACGFRASGAVRTTSHLTGHPLQEVAYRCAL